MIKNTLNFEREKLIRPFGFKGGYMNEIWQVIAGLGDQDGNMVAGIGVQNVLWSDAQIFSRYPEAVSNSMMLMTTAYALEKAQGVSYSDPLELFEYLYPMVYEYAAGLTGDTSLRKSFALNAMVSVDHAAWKLHSQHKGIKDFYRLVPETYRNEINIKNSRAAAIPLISYNISEESIRALAQERYPIFKIKIGSDPDRDNDADKMLEYDKQRVSLVHSVMEDIKSPYTESGYTVYYLDANGRYPNKEYVLRLLDHMDSIGALERVVLFEEPFSEEDDTDVGDLPVCIVADESAHSEKEAVERMDQGYGAIALKPVAKTMSMSLKVLKLALQRDIRCFCADLTVSPLLVDWNKCLASRLAPIKGLKIGSVETNGAQNYSRWDELMTFHPGGGRKWTELIDGCFELDDEFYENSGGVFDRSEYYDEMIGL